MDYEDYFRVWTLFRERMAKKQILIDRTELMGKIIAIESGCLDVKSRSVIQQIKATILHLPAMEQKEEKGPWQK